MKEKGQWARERESQCPNWKPPREKKFKFKPKQVDISIAELLIYQKYVFVSKSVCFHGSLYGLKLS